MKKRATFAKRGALAIASAAWGVELDAPDRGEVSFDTMPGGFAIVDVVGPLTHHDEWIWDSYDAIKARCAEALASGAQTLVLRIDSPGGDVSGCFETAREIRAMASAAGKKVVAYADGMAASAGYGLACAASEIYTSASGSVGSIGCINVMVDAVAADRAAGLSFAVIASGARKADGNPHVAITDAAREACQQEIDSLADLFFDLVRESRGIEAKPFEARMFHGAGAKAAGLVDAVCTFSEMLSLTSAFAVEEKMDWKEAMRKAAEEGDEDAKKMLRALEEKEAPPASKSDVSMADDAGDDADAEAEEDEKKDPKKEDGESKAAAAALARVGEVERELAKFKAERETNEREAILSSRSDLSEGQVKLLRAQSFEQMKKTLAILGPAPKGVRNAAITRGETQNGELASLASPDDVEHIERAMGLRRNEGSVVRKGNTMELQPMSPEAARKALAEIGGAK